MQAISSNRMSPVNLSELSLDEPVAAPQVDAQGGGFQDLLVKSMGETAQLSLQADQNIYSALTMGDVTNAEVLTSLKKADFALKTMVQFRNKFMEMYQEFQQKNICV